MCAKSNVCILNTSRSISGSLIQRWLRVHFTCNVICNSWVAHFMSASFINTENWIMILDHALTWNSQVAWQICQETLVWHVFKLSCTVFVTRFARINYHTAGLWSWLLIWLTTGRICKSSHTKTARNLISHLSKFSY